MEGKTKQDKTKEERKEKKSEARGDWDGAA